MKETHVILDRSLPIPSRIPLAIVDGLLNLFHVRATAFAHDATFIGACSYDEICYEGAEAKTSTH